MKTLSISTTIPIIAASIIISWLIRNIIKARQYSRNGLQAGLAINCVTEEFYDEAMERAIAMDGNREESEE